MTAEWQWTDDDGIRYVIQLEGTFWPADPQVGIFEEGWDIHICGSEPELPVNLISYLEGNYQDEWQGLFSEY